MKYKCASLENVQINAPFIRVRLERNHSVTIPTNIRKCKETGRFDAFKLDWKPGMPNKPHFFWDSDVAKVLEGMAYDAVLYPDAERRKQLDDFVQLVISSAGKDGYLNSYFNCVEPEKRWKCLGGYHELYCAGHLMEAAVAYYHATGKRNFLETMCRYADCIGSVFGAEPGKRRGVPGHEEIELALCKLADATGNSKYIKLAEYFINDRGTEPNTFDEEQRREGQPLFTLYSKKSLQAHLPVREQHEAVGHAVRAVYLYSGMAEIAGRTGDARLLEACENLWDSITTQKMYLTGGIGSMSSGERFGNPWHLPNDFSYVESCAAIGLCLFARRMMNLTGQRKYADVLEQTICNAVLSGISLDGKHFFYANRFQLDASTEWKLNGTGHSAEREEWFDCSCCPTNFCRFIPQIASFSFTEMENGMRIELPFAAKAACGGLDIEITGDYPYDSHIGITILQDAPQRTLALRIPGWCKDWQLSLNGKSIDATLNDGYAELTREWKAGDKLQLNLDMPVRRIYANPHVTSCAGQVALMRGPIVYVLEEIDQPGMEFERVLLARDTEIETITPKGLPDETIALRFKASVLKSFPDNSLYQETPPELLKEKVTLTAVPYALWGNRGKVTQLRLWIRELS
ncbi:MAG: glycoside hydrolase family 127 protein [Victivallales bacterium]|nr:glycoside hydrolase family 127 protein [Victivallales bacterium]